MNKAIDFFKKTGMHHVKFLLDDIDKDFIEIHSNVDGKYSEDKVSVLDIKQIVEAFDIVNALGGLHMAKADAMDLDGFEKDSPYWNKVKQAINIVEQCND